MKESCAHVVKTIDTFEPNTKGCEECERAGRMDWVALRLCLTCGHVGCCDSSPGRHARGHFKKTKHAVIVALPKREWKWCYLDEMYA